MNIKDFLVQSVLPMIESVGETKLVEVLQNLHDSNPDEYKAVIAAGVAFIKPLQKYTQGTSTPIDDGILAFVDEAVVMSANQNGVKI